MTNTALTAKGLIDILTKVPPETPIIGPTDDHSYTRVSAGKSLVIFHYSGDISEDYAPLGNDWVRLMAIVID